jgi:hypothetical protein
MEHEKPYSVYVKTDDAGRIVAVNSDAFLHSTDGWQKVAEGHGDKFHHAQGNFFPLPLMDENGVFQYKLENGEPVERTEEEMKRDIVQIKESRSQEERLSAIEGMVEMLLSGVTSDE